MEASEFTEPVAPPAETNAAPADAGETWQRQRDGREFVPKPGGKGKIFRQGEETVAQARARDQLPPEERRPRRKPKMPPRRSQKVDLKELEAALAMGFKMPGDMLRYAGDEWGVQHFNIAGPILARSLVNAAEFNPWLREKLEAMASGEQVMIQMASLLGLAGAAVMYAVPPIVYYMNLPVSDQRRALLGVPPRRPPAPANAAEPPPDQPAAPTFGPEPAAAPAA